ncbi:hypothetical protein [Sphingomonas endolithica]|uniref:hypothetical protein n=1 Tax=Sphingomonas endolithica TaxID=2972485 RepID=UPI0021AEB6D2|nr:hypothetical protein [Sphingomonas sp. ZFBP2030]
MIAIAAALLSATAPSCAPVPGANHLWQPNIRWIIVGEMHGTNESPDAFVNLICLAAKTGRPVTIALEYSSDDQAAIDAYLSSDGAAQARASLLKLSLFASDMQDGRGSIAFLRLWEQLRVMKQAGRIVGVVASDVGRSTPQGQERNAAMAQTWTSITAANDGIILALVGNLHAMRRPITIANRTIVPAGSIMPAKRTITMTIDGNGGKAWNCQDDGCLQHDNGDPRQAAHGITYLTAADRQWDATYELGVPTTAAVPANGTKPAPPSK